HPCKEVPIQSPQQSFLAGARAIAPILLGVVPFGLLVGLTSVAAGFSLVEALASSVFVFAAAAQLAAAELLRLGAPLGVVVLTMLVINLRFTMYSASLAPHFNTLGARWRFLFAYLLTDQAYAVSIIHFEHSPQTHQKRWFYLGAAVVMWSVYQASTAVGVVVGANVPPGWGLDFAVPLTFLALLGKTIRSRPSLGAALAAGAVSVVGFGLPHNLGLVCAALAGVTAGMAAERGV
ncbi:MAG: AzlC family ABC transporter permease, partial [Deferrisomatales bacterium]|nr:AzlC family ABC transporter permease [Deferrisomatales bacterium]